MGTPHNDHEPWTEDEITILRTRWLAGDTLSQIGALVHRSVHSVNSKRKSVRPPLPGRPSPIKQRTSGPPHPVPVTDPTLPPLASERPR